MNNSDRQYLDEHDDWQARRYQRPLRIIICGGRDWKAAEVIRKRMNSLPIGSVIVHGACKTGADALADWYATTERPSGGQVFQVERHPADWKRYGRRAGSLRNQAMADAGADLCIAFPTKRSKGTWDMVRRAREAGIPVEVICDSDR